MMRRLLAFSALVVLPFAVFATACDDDDDTADTGTNTDGGAGTDGSTKTDSGDHTGHDAGTPTEDAGPTPVRCTQAEFDQAAANPVGGDYTGFPGADITFPSVATPSQYTPRCVKVKAGAQITFAGRFSFHPLEANGGDTPSPIPTQTTDVDGGALSITVTTPGTFGFQCQFHPTTMFGAIQVVP